MPSSTLTLPQWLQAKNLQSVTVYGTSLAGGVGTWSTPVDIAARPSGGTASFEAFSLSRNRGLVEISSSDSYIENNVGEKISITATVSEISSSAGSVLPALANLYDYLMVIATYRAEGASSTATYAVGVVGVIGTAEWAINTGKNTNSINLSTASKAAYFGLLSAMPSNFGA